MRDVVRGIWIGLAALVIVMAVASRLELASVSIPRGTSTVPWLLSRAAGVTAFAALALDVIIGLLVSTRAAHRLFAKGVAVDLHRWLSPVALGLVLGHALLLLADGYIRFDALDLLVPFASSYRPLAVGIGVIAAYVAVVVHASFALRKRLGATTWRRLHYLSFVALAGAALHAVFAGTDASASWLRSVYGVPIAVVVLLVAYRVSRALRGSATSSTRQRA